MTRSVRCIVTSILLFSAVPARAADSLDWLVAPYVWLPRVSMDQSSPGNGGGGISLSDLLEKTDAAGMIRVEAASGRWGLTLDYIFLGLSERTSITLPGPLEPIADVSAELDLTVLEFGGVYRLSGAEEGTHLLLGYRGIRAETTVLVTPDDAVTRRVDTDNRLDDVYLGARYLNRYNNWDFALRGDYSVGDTDGVLSLVGSVGYRFPGPFALQAGYRYVDLKYDATTDAGDPAVTAIEFFGPFLGFVFRF